MFVVVLGNNFDPFLLWDIGVKSTHIECGDDYVVWKWCVFNAKHCQLCV